MNHVYKEDAVLYHKSRYTVSSNCIFLITVAVSLVFIEQQGA